MDEEEPIMNNERKLRPGMPFDRKVGLGEVRELAKKILKLSGIRIHDIILFAIFIAIFGYGIYIGEDFIFVRLPALPVIAGFGYLFFFIMSLGTKWGYCRSFVENIRYVKIQNKLDESSIGEDQQ